jgi:hypothetical protein
MHRPVHNSNNNETIVEWVQPIGVCWLICIVSYVVNVLNAIRTEE